MKSSIILVIQSPHTINHSHVYIVLSSSSPDLAWCSRVVEPLIIEGQSQQAGAHYDQLVLHWVRIDSATHCVVMRTIGRLLILRHTVEVKVRLRIVRHTQERLLRQLLRTVFVWGVECCNNYVDSVYTQSYNINLTVPMHPNKSYKKS